MLILYIIHIFISIAVTLIKNISIIFSIISKFIFIICFIHITSELIGAFTNNIQLLFIIITSLLLYNFYIKTKLDFHALFQIKAPKPHSWILYNLKSTLGTSDEDSEDTTEDSGASESAANSGTETSKTEDSKPEGEESSSSTNRSDISEDSITAALKENILKNAYKGRDPKGKGKRKLIEVLTPIEEEVQEQELSKKDQKKRKVEITQEDQEWLDELHSLEERDRLMARNKGRISAQDMEREREREREWQREQNRIKEQERLEEEQIQKAIQESLITAEFERRRIFGVGSSTDPVYNPQPTQPTQSTQNTIMSDPNNYEYSDDENDNLSDYSYHSTPTVTPQNWENKDFEKIREKLEWQKTDEYQSVETTSTNPSISKKDLLKRIAAEEKLLEEKIAEEVEQEMLERVFVEERKLAEEKLAKEKLAEEKEIALAKTSSSTEKNNEDDDDDDDNNQGGSGINLPNTDTEEDQSSVSEKNNSASNNSNISFFSILNQVFITRILPFISLIMDFLSEIYL